MDASWRLGGRNKFAALQFTGNLDVIGRLHHGTAIREDGVQCEWICGCFRGGGSGRNKFAALQFVGN